MNTASCSLPHSAPWIWIEDPVTHGKCTRFLRFHLEFDSAETEPLLVAQVSADQRFQLFLDGERIAIGPDRSDLDHWNLRGIQQRLLPGPHRLEAWVYYIEEDQVALAGSRDGKPQPSVAPPMAQMTWRGGLTLEGRDWGNRLNTGVADWKVQDFTEAVTLSRKTGLGYHDVGPAYGFDMARWNAEPPVQSAATVLGPMDPGLEWHGIQRPGWKLQASPLPPQRLLPFAGGEFRSGPWRGESIVIPAHQTVEILWDMQAYHCGYPELTWSGGAGSVIEVEWAESLYENIPDSPVNSRTPKGHRSEVDGKVWLGFGDSYTASGARESSPSLWWRAGRYIRIRLRVAATPLHLERVSILTTRYPLDAEDEWRSDDPGWDALFGLFHTTLEVGAHEGWADSPYYEQMLYVGDTRLNALSNYLCYRDDRLSRYAIDLLRWSRNGSPEGMVAERYPSAWRQDSGTYSMMYAWMVRDFLYWRDDLDFVRTQLPALRQLMESFLPFCNADGLMGRLPGWPFVDWAAGWISGCGPGMREGDSSIVNLHWILTLQAAAQIEDAVGESVLADRHRRRAELTWQAVCDRYACDTLGGFRDTKDPTPTSEHAQALALLTGLASPEMDQRLLETLESGRLDNHCTIYFRFYLLEALARHGRAELFHKRLDEWRLFPGKGFLTVPEQPEPTRSDCHAWSSHPLFHSYASIAGIRSTAPGFRKLRIDPLPGPFQEFEAKCLHPRGIIQVRYNRGQLDVTLPDGVEWER